MTTSVTTEVIRPVRLRVGWDDVLAIASICAVGCLVYGVFIRGLGFYWDDWPVVWVYSNQGSAGVAQYFAGQRPAYGWVIAHVAQIFGIAPIGWHAVALAVRCAASAAVYVALCALWPSRKDIGWLVGTLVLLYPGFTLQPIALGFIPYFLSFFLFAVSLAATMLAINTKSYQWLFVVIALASEAISYLLIEYFVGLELLRLVIIAILARRNVSTWSRKEMRSVLIRWSPYAAVWAGYVIWRALIFHVVSGYGPGYMNVGTEVSQVMRSPIHEMLARGFGGIRNIVAATVLAWARPFNMDLITRNPGAAHSLIIVTLVLLVAIFAFLQLSKSASQAPIPESTRGEAGRFIGEGLSIGIAALLVGGLPLAVSGLQINFTPYPSYTDRFTIPFILGSSLTFACLLVAAARAKWSRVALVLVFVFAFSAFQVRNESLYREEWHAQKTLFWQLAWRAPVLKRGTSLFLDDVPKSLIGNHSAGTLDLLYNRDRGAGRLNYFIFDLSQAAVEEKAFSGTPLSYRPNQPLTGRVRSFQFQGTTSQSLVGWISPVGTLRLISPDESTESLGSSALCLNLSEVSQPGQTISDGPNLPEGPLLKVFGAAEAKDKWLYYYQRAELQRQLRHWPEVAALGDEAMRQGYQPVDLSEWFPFIEAYARTGKYRLAADLSKKMLAANPDALAPLSSLWTRIVRDGGGHSPEFDAAAGDLAGNLVLGAMR